MANDNNIPPRPQFARHRIVTGAPVAVDGIPSTLPIRGSLNCRGWRSIVGYVKLTGGAAPTVRLQMLRVVEYVDGTGAAVQEFALGELVTDALVSGRLFVANVNDDRVYFRIHAITGNPTEIDIQVAGDAASCDSTFPIALNPADVLTYDGAGNPLTITRTVNGIVKRKTLTWVAGNMTAVSEWVEV